MSHVPTEIQADAARIATALEGGYAAVTVRSLETGQHCKVIISGKKYAPAGSRSKFVSRAKREGRVGIGTGADLLEVRDPDREYPDNYVGRLYLKEGEWRAGQQADPLRVWTAEKVLAYARGAYDLAAVADVYLATKCCECGRKLEDPVFIERMTGPECYGKATGSKNAPHAKPAAQTELAGAEFLGAPPEDYMGNGDHSPPPGHDEAEARMHALESAGDLVQSVDEAVAKAVTKGDLTPEEGKEAKASTYAVPAVAEALAILHGKTPPSSPPCMGCGAPEDTHVAGECVR